ncbi:putative PpiC-type peptidyl-prolyl cis-trans isomerase [uncultured delta proteobacterium]|uniref:Putative PpiC-type peptidyl-prolyl cis-trans isomerase n=1 Tax=uncultured delta proteobacterium TaxID=34034 RepID=A0A212JJ35_9DELT|nr:putative PpiC-type peptidyl-prolyl cis-trans isomerase [uncultured delta proteobacterium]
MLDLIRHRAQSWAVKVIFGIIILVFVAWGVGSNNQSGPGTAATVNGKPILIADFQRELRAEEEQFRGMAPDASAELMKNLRLPERVLERLVVRSLIEQEAKRLGITVTPVEYAAYLRAQGIFNGDDGKFSQKRYEQFVANQGRNIAEFEQSQMRALLAQKMQGYVTSAVTVTPEEARRRLGFELEKRVVSYVLFAADGYRKDITITDDAIASYYDANLAQFSQPATIAVSYLDVTPAALAPSMDVAEAEVDKAYAAGPLQYNIRQVQLPVPDGADAATEDAMKAKLEIVATALRAGTDLAEAAKDLVAEFPDARMGETGMMEARRIPEEILGSLAGLHKNDVAAVVKMENMLVLSQLLATDPDWSQPEETVRAALRLALGEEKASLAFRDVQAQAEDMVAIGKPLAEIAKELKVDIKTTNPAPREELGYALQLRRPEQLSLFEGAKGSLVNGVLETQEGFVVAEIGDTAPAGVKPLTEVRDLILEVLTQREAEKKSEEAARAVIAEFANGIPAAYKDKVITSEPFTRQNNIPGLGYAKALSDAIFASPVDVWMKEPFATSKGAVIAMPTEVIPLNDEEWAKIEARAVEVVLNSKRGQAMNAYIADLHKKAEVLVPHKELFGQ